MDEKELLTVKEVAEILGVSVQAIYNRLENNFKPYLKIINGKKWLDKAVLKDNAAKLDSSDFKENFKAILNLLERQNDQLGKELETKNKQINELNLRLAESNAALVAAHQMAHAAQALHAGTIQHQLTGENDSADQQTEKKKHGFFTRVFGKGNE